MRHTRIQKNDELNSLCESYKEMTKAPYEVGFQEQASNHSPAAATIIAVGNKEVLR